ncbi:MAG TPA: 4'-phosphopantetheinyl transferase superfamily protein [Saprospiraceae bacterium]|nr:4'-phosphopantetheinyl transferase superfamily protein [Saprospiraceae bacterium]
MPLLLTRHPFPGTTFGLWQIAEEEAFFREELPLSSGEEAEIARLKNDLRRHEWLAGRWLLHKLTGAPQRLPLAKDAFSKPFFPENQHLACSLSHSHGIVGAFIGDWEIKGLEIRDWRLGNDLPQSPTPNLLIPNFPSCGCDVQVLVEKMPRLASKFLNVEEERFVANHTDAIQFDLFHVFWTAKESLYKAYGLKELDFRANLRVEPFEWKENRGTTRGWVEKNDFRQAYRLLFEKIVIPEAGELVWTVCLPEKLR